MVVAAESGVSSYLLRSPFCSLSTHVAFRVSAGAFLLSKQNGWFYARAAFLNHVIGWTFIIGAVFPLARAFRPGSVAVRTGLALVFVVTSVFLYSDRDVAPIFGHLSPLAGAPHR